MKNTTIPARMIAIRARPPIMPPTRAPVMEWPGLLPGPALLVEAELNLTGLSGTLEEMELERFSHPIL